MLSPSIISKPYAGSKNCHPTHQIVWYTSWLAAFQEPLFSTCVLWASWGWSLARTNPPGRRALTSLPCNKKSWFINARLICLQYNLQDPLLLMQEPPNKVLRKRQCKSAVMSYWEEKLPQQASQLPSLLYFKPQFMSFRDPHFIWDIQLVPQVRYSCNSPWF